MSKKGVIFWDKKINKRTSNKIKGLTQIDIVDVNKILVSKKEPYCKKVSFIGYVGNNNIRTLCMKLPQMIWYAKYFENSKTMSFMAGD